MVGVVMEGPRRLAAQHVRVQAGVRDPRPQPLVEGRADVARTVELVPHPGLLQALGVPGHLAARGVVAQRVEHRLRGRHARLHRGVRAFDLGHVEEARAAADEHAAGEGELRDGLEPALVERARSVGDPAPALEGGADGGVGLEALELLERREVRIGVVQAHHEADRDLVVLEVVHERPAVGVGLHRPAHGVHDQPLPVLLRRHLPQLLQADAVGLGIGVAAQVEPLEQALRERAAAALGDDGLTRVQLHPGLEAGLALAVAADAHVPGDDALHRAVVAVQHLGRREAREHVHAERLGLLAEPAAHVAQAHDVVALVVHLRRRRQAPRPRLGEEQEPVLRSGRVERRPALLPVREQLVQRTRLDHRSGQDVRAHLGALLHQAHLQLAAVLLGELAQPDRRREARRTAADDDDVEFHAFSFHRGLQALVDAGVGAPRKGPVCYLNRRPVLIEHCSIVTGRRPAGHRR